MTHVVSSSMMIFLKLYICMNNMHTIIVPVRKIMDGRDKLPAVKNKHDKYRITSTSA